MVSVSFLLRVSFTALGLFSFAATLSADDRPSIVVILCDDLGYGDLECYGHPHIKTPNLNRLAEEGMRCTDFYSTAPVCSPSRVGLLTGRSPNRAGVFDWIPPAKRPTKDARDQVHMRSSEVTIPSLLKNAGYATCMSGKWHCNSKFNSPAQPQPGDFGFDHWLATQNNAAPSHENPTNFVRNGEPVGKVDAFSCQYVVTEVLDWLGNRENTEQPFFAYVAFHEPHEPVASPEPLVEEYRAVADNEDQAHYFANVANVDDAVGRLVGGLERLGERDNTLIVFTSDNGPETLNRYRSANRSYGQPGPLRGMKLHTTDAGFRVAGIINWKGVFKPGFTYSYAVSALDLLPTFCQIAKVRLPNDLKLDGTSFIPALAGGKIVRDKPLIWAYFNALNQRRVAMRDGKWKVLASLNDGSLKRMTNITTETYPLVRDAKLTDVQVFDVSQDIGESTDLAKDDPALRERFTTRIVDAYEELVSDSHVWTVAD